MLLLTSVAADHSDTPSPGAVSARLLLPKCAPTAASVARCSSSLAMTQGVWKQDKHV